MTRKQAVACDCTIYLENALPSSDGAGWISAVDDAMETKNGRANMAGMLVRYATRETIAEAERLVMELVRL